MASQLPALTGLQGPLATLLDAPVVRPRRAWPSAWPSLLVLVLGKRWLPRVADGHRGDGVAALASRFSGYSAQGAVIGALPRVAARLLAGLPSWDTLSMLLVPGAGDRAGQFSWRRPPAPRSNRSATASAGTTTAT
jgi:hypothetical protein